jgi:hypothetical protein
MTDTKNMEDQNHPCLYLHYIQPSSIRVKLGFTWNRALASQFSLAYVHNDPTTLERYTERLK